jgi:hypothetical protein
MPSQASATLQTPTAVTLTQLQAVAEDSLLSRSGKLWLALVVLTVLALLQAWRQLRLLR